VGRGGAQAREPEPDGEELFSYGGGVVALIGQDHLPYLNVFVMCFCVFCLLV